jgi:hypothetical protein
MEQDLQKLLHENLEYNKKIFEVCVKTKRYIFWSEVFSIVKMLVFVVPLIIAVIYAIPLLQEALATYNQLMGELNKAGNLPSQMPENILNQLLRK